MSQVDPVERFSALVSGREPPLDEAALALAAGADPALDPARWLAELDRLAEGVCSLDDLVHRLFLEEGFAGNTTDYYDPRNSLLPYVLVRRTGIPITLAVVCIEVGRRAGIPLEGVGMPGHFLVRSPGTERYLDVFDGGRLLDLAGCENRFRAATGTGRNVPFGQHLLPRTSTRAILARMLENLRAIYRDRRRPADLEWVLRMRLRLGHDSPLLIVELAHAQGEQGRWLDGARLIDSYVEGAEQDAGSRTTAEQLDEMRAAARSLRAHLN
jgi:regulator of sirC expression with transglutaminase-like and TPR domain